jgi:hypothetical protein
MALPGVKKTISESFEHLPPKPEITEGGIVAPANYIPVGLSLVEGEKREELLLQMQSRSQS